LLSQYGKISYSLNTMEQTEENLEVSWEHLLTQIVAIFGKKPDLNGVLFMIGVQELGKGVKVFTKEEKQDLMHIAICKVLSLSGFYELEGIDEQGWPHWKLVKKLPFFDLLGQEKVIKMHIIEYFNKEIFI
jgi:hypothetical protein